MGTWLVHSYCCDHRDDSWWIVLEQVSSLAELSLLGRPVSRREFQEIESDILQQALRTMHDLWPYHDTPWSLGLPEYGTTWVRKSQGLLELDSSHQPQWVPQCQNPVGSWRRKTFPLPTSHVAKGGHVTLFWPIRYKAHLLGGSWERFPSLTKEKDLEGEFFSFLLPSWDGNAVT